ncbi:MAG TPA: molecular chaperone TorD family protein [Anaeromyxobacter sp.]
MTMQARREDGPRAVSRPPTPRVTDAGGDRRLWRRDVYAALAIAFRRPPLPFVYGDLASQLGELLSVAPWGDVLASRLRSLAIDESAAAHCALVLVGGAARTPVRLYESCWRGGKSLWGEAAAACTAYYRRVGFAVDESVHECPDALAVELELMAHLCDAGEEAEAARFLTEHLLRWAPQAAASLAAAPLPPFFRLAGDVLGRFLAAEEDELAAAQPARGFDGANG